MSISTKFPPGHFYSPIVNPDEVRDYVRQSRLVAPEDIDGISIDLEMMRQFWQTWVANEAPEVVPSTKIAGQRYYSENNSFGLGDALILGAMLRSLRPSRIIEVGSGFSTARILDVLEQEGLDRTVLTVIDPFPDRLPNILLGADGARFTLVESPIQVIDLALFRTLGDKDILFIDSTHVVKTGSDVHFEITRVLPSLNPGVHVHFHDVQYPFEYPDAWIFEQNLSWNEAYMLQAFLMYNSRFKIKFFNNLFGRACNEEVRNLYPRLAQFPTSFGGSIWLRRAE